jgi:hypothetical protein
MNVIIKITTLTSTTTGEEAIIADKGMPIRQKIPNKPTLKIAFMLLDMFLKLLRERLLRSGQKRPHKTDSDRITATST